MTKNNKNKTKKFSLKNNQSNNQNDKQNEDEIVSLALDTSTNQINSCNLDGAIQTLTDALQSYPYSVPLLDALSDLLLQNNNVEAGKALIEQALNIDPQGNHKRWLSYAQLLTDNQALEALNKGIYLLKELISSNKVNDKMKQEYNEELAKAYCSVAELYMTDLCFEPDAESSCEAAVNEACKIAPQLDEVVAALVSLRLSQKRNQDAANSLLTIIPKIRALLEKYHSLTIKEEFNNNSEYESLLKDLPSPETSISLAKLAMELVEQDASFNDFAQELLDFALTIDDENAEILYLAGMNCTLGTPDYNSAYDFFIRAQDVLKSVLRIDPSLEGPVHMLEIVTEAIENIKQNVTEEDAMEQ